MCTHRPVLFRRTRCCIHPISVYYTYIYIYMCAHLQSPSRLHFNRPPLAHHSPHRCCAPSPPSAPRGLIESTPRRLLFRAVETRANPFSFHELSRAESHVSLLRSVRRDFFQLAKRLSPVQVLLFFSCPPLIASAHRNIGMLSLKNLSSLRMVTIFQKFLRRRLKKLTNKHLVLTISLSLKISPIYWR